MNKNDVKVIGFYVLIALVLWRFLVIPLRNCVEKEKAVLANYAEIYRTKSSLVKKYHQIQSGYESNASVKGNTRLTSLYKNDTPYTHIQSECIQGIIARAEKYGMMVINFEIPEIVVAKNTSEIPVVIRLRGAPKAIISLLQEMHRWDKILSFHHFETIKGDQDFIFTLTVSTFRAEK